MYVDSGSIILYIGIDMVPQFRIRLTSCLLESFRSYVRLSAFLSCELIDSITLLVVLNNLLSHLSGSNNLPRIDKYFVPRLISKQRLSLFLRRRS